MGSVGVARDTLVVGGVYVPPKVPSPVLRMQMRMRMRMMTRRWRCRRASHEELEVLDAGLC